MKILMLNPPYFKKFSRSQRSPAVTKSGCIYYPIWLAYATGVLEEVGHEVRLVDAPGDGYDLDQVIDMAKEFQPELTVVDTSTPSIYNDVKVAERIKAEINTFITLVGTHVSALPEESFSLSPAIDAIARHEYDYTIRDLAHCLQEKNNLASVQGLSFKEDGKVVHNPDRPYIKNLDELPFVSKVYKKHLHIENYFYGANRHPVVTILGGRGCPHRCIYCVYPQTFTGRKYRYRSVRDVVDELVYIKDTFPQAKEVFLEDDTLTVNRKRSLELADEILARGLKITWSTNSRADADFETLRAIKKAGCRLLCVGFESGNQQILDRMNKRLTVQQSREFMKNAKKVGMLIHGCFLVGLPGEDKSTMQQTLDLAMELRPDTVQFFPIMVYPGTEAYDWANDNHYLITTNYSEWLTSEGLHNCVVSRPGLTNRELVEFCDFARHTFYMRPSYFLSKFRQIIFDPREGKRIIKAFRTSIKYLIRGSFSNTKSV